LGDKSARQPNNPEEEHLYFGQDVKIWCYYTTKYAPNKVDIYVEEQLILNLILSYQRKEPVVLLNKPKLLITRFTNA
jgi:hypothetical protein